MNGTRRNLVLIVEDDKEYQFLLKHGHERSHISCEFCFADSAEKARDFLQTAPYRPQIILLDYDLPGMNVIEFLDEIKTSEAYRGIPTLMFSMYATPELIGKAYKHGVNAFIAKPDDFTSMVDLWHTLCSFWNQTAQLPQHF